MVFCFSTTAASLLTCTANPRSSTAQNAVQSAIPQENARSVNAGAASITAMANGTTMASEPAIRSATVAPVLITSVTLAAAGNRATSTTAAAAALRSCSTTSHRSPASAASTNSSR